MRKKIVKIMLSNIALSTLISVKIFTKIEIINTLDNPIIATSDKFDRWIVINKKSQKSIETDGKWKRRLYWSDDMTNYYATPEYISPDILTIKLNGSFDIKESLIKPKQDQKAEIKKSFEEINKMIIRPETKTVHEYPTNKNSFEVKIEEKTSPREIQILNASNSDIYLYLDCNYKTKNFGGGYDKKTSPIKLLEKTKSGYKSFMIYVPEKEEFTFRWTKDSNNSTPNLKAANWYEAHYKNYENQKIIIIDIYDNGKYIERTKPTISGMKIIDKELVAAPIFKAFNTLEFQANEIIFKKNENTTIGQNAKK